MRRSTTRRIFGLVFVLLASTALAEAGVVAAEKNSFLPLIEGSTYAYDGTFKGKTSRTSVTVKSVTQGEIEAFYFVRDEGPPRIIGSNIFFDGLCIRHRDGLMAVSCFWEKGIEDVNFKKDSVLILKHVPEKGQSAKMRDRRTSEETRAKTLRFTVDENETVTVPAGTFENCIKIKIEEIWPADKREKAVTHTGYVWLANGVGMVKWVRSTGRVEVLTAYKLAEPPIKHAPEEDTPDPANPDAGKVRSSAEDAKRRPSHASSRSIESRAMNNT